MSGKATDNGPVAGEHHSLAEIDQLMGFRLGICRSTRRVTAAQPHG